MMKYELRKNTREIGYKDRKDIMEGCTLDQGDQEPEILKSFDSKEEAMKELRNYKSTVEKCNGFYMVTEHYVEENEYDEEGGWISGGDIWGFTSLVEL